ncbi:MAG: choice-of-anchor J domain-containing protein [Bacteroidales bacterium]|jgi:hypothetical protein|nr:choice-of-anchor J domain-containing protein [Bacteroidales bacterium]
MKKLLVILLLATGALSVGWTQSVPLADYSFACTEGTFTPLTDATVIAVFQGLTGDAFQDKLAVNPNATVSPEDVNSIDCFDIGFDFKFAGNVYNKFVIVSNGFIKLGYNTVNLSMGTTGAAGFTAGGMSKISIGAYLTPNTTNGNLVRGKASTLVSYKMDGVSPNRTLTVEYLNLCTTRSNDDSASWQIILHETTNQAQIIFGNMNISLATVTSQSNRMKVGLLLDGAAAALMHNYRVPANNTSGSVDWTETVLAGGISGSANVGRVTRAHVLKFPIGTTYTWTPPVPPVNAAALRKFTIPADSIIINPTSSEVVAIEIKNDGSDPITNNAHFTLEVDGVILATENPTLNIAYEATDTCTFTAKADLSSAGTHTIRAWVDLTGDANHTDDTIEMTVRSVQLPNADASVTAITQPNAVSTDLTNSEVVKATIYNGGATAITNYNITVEIDGAIKTTEPVTGANIAPLASGEYTFASVSGLEGIGDHTIRVWIDVAGDSDKNNDTATKVINNRSCLVSDYPVEIDFESEIAPCWKSISNNTQNASDLGRTTSMAVMSPGSAHSGTYVWQFYSRNSAADYKQYLISPPLSTDKAKRLEFYYASERSGNNELFNVGYSTTDANVASFTWSDVISDADRDIWKKYTSDVLTAGVKYIAIQYAPTSNRYHLYIDDLKITEIPDNEAAVTAIVYPQENNGDLTTDEKVKITITNNGGTAITSIPVYVSVNGGVPVTENATVSIAPYGVSDDYTFTNGIDLSGIGTYEIKVWVALPGDVDQTNDTLSKVINNVAANEAAVAAVVYPQAENADLTNDEKVKITIVNNGSAAITSIPVYISVNGGTPATEEAVISIAPYTSADYTFTTGVDLSVVGTYSIKVWVALPGDVDRTNDTLTVSVENINCEITAYPYEQHFESLDFLDCWRAVAGDPTGYNTSFENSNGWGIRTDAQHGGTSSWKFTSSAGSINGNDNQYLISPKLSQTSGYKILSFYFNRSHNLERFMVGYSTTTNDTIAFVWSDTITGNASIGTWKEFTKSDIPANARYIAIRYYTHYNYWTWIDDLTINEMKPAAALTAIVSPDNTEPNFMENNDVTVQLGVTNMGTIPLDSVYCSYVFNSEPQVSEWVRGRIELNGIGVLSMSQHIDMSTLGQNTLKAWVNVAIDGNIVPTDDTIKNVYNVTSSSYTEFSVPSIVRPDSIITTLTDTVVITFRNTGTKDIGTSRTSVTMFYSVNGGAAVSEKCTFGNTASDYPVLAPNSEVTYKFAAPVTFASTGIYIIRAWAGIIPLVTGGPNSTPPQYSIDTAVKVINVTEPVSNETLNSSLKVAVYPNPTDGRFSVNVSSKVTMEVINVTGVTVRKEVISGTKELSLPNAGIYVLRFTDGQGRTTTQRLIVR